MTKLATEAEVAEWLGVKPKTLADWRRAGSGPPHTFAGRSARYHWPDVQRWAAHRAGGRRSGS
jgi:predicted site-specific integrase-resolvase